MVQYEIVVQLLKHPLVKSKRFRLNNLHLREIRMEWIDEHIPLTVNHNGRHRQPKRFRSIGPPIANPSRDTNLKPPVHRKSRKHLFFSLNELGALYRYLSTNRHQVCRHIFRIDVYEILNGRKRQSFRRISNRHTGRVPTARAATRTFPGESGCKMPLPTYPPDSHQL